MVHLKHIQGYNGSFLQLVEEFGNLRYDRLAEFLGNLAAKLNNDAKHDESRGRIQLARALRSSSEQLAAAAVCVQETWRICAPYMTEAESS
jgi:hypothetical protein